jgi:hypothetical protein
MDGLAIYEAMFPIGWIGKMPSSVRTIMLNDPIPDDWKDVVVARQLTCGINIEAQRRGFVIYDFSAWPPGIVRPSRAPIRLGDVSDDAKKALIQRLRLINSHLMLLHAASMHDGHGSPVVLRVERRDLYHQDADDEGNSFWFGLTGPIASSWTRVESNRCNDSLPTSTFELALGWLDAIVKLEAINEFDLLSQAFTAVWNHDYPLALITSWSICERRINALCVKGQIPLTRPRDGGFVPVKTLMNELAAAGTLTGNVQRQLDKVRESRNIWIHGGPEPDETLARNALESATLLLRDLLPGLDLRAPHAFVLR